MWDFGLQGHLWSQNDAVTTWLRLKATSNCFLHLHYTYRKCLSALICCPWAYGSSLKYLHPHYLGQILEFWDTSCGVKMMSLHHGWGWQPPQTPSCIHTLHVQSFWAHWYSVHGHRAVVSNTYTHTNWVRFGVLGHFLWSQNDVITSWLRVTATSNSFLRLHYIFKVFEHIDMLSMGIWQ